MPNLNMFWRRNGLFTPVSVACSVMHDSLPHATRQPRRGRRLAIARRLLRKRVRRAAATVGGSLPTSGARRLGAALFLLAGIGLLGLLQFAPPATALIAAPADPTGTLLARLTAQDEALRVLSERVTSLTGDAAGARADSDRQNAAIKDLAASQRALAQTMGALRDELSANRDALSKLTAERASYDAQLSAALTRITTLADNLATALDTTAQATPSGGRATKPSAR